MTLTLETIQDNLGVWIPQVQGRYINEDWNPTNEGFGAQCWDLAANWSKFLGLPVINTGGTGRWPGWAGNMVDAFPQTAEIAAAYELVAPNAAGLPGDIAVWGDSYKEYYPATHVAVLIRDNGSLLFCGSQNSTAALVDNPYPKWSSGPATIQNLPRRGLIGFIRPKVGGIQYQGTTTTTSEDDNEMLSPEAQAYLEKTFLTKADGGQLREDTTWQNEILAGLFTKADGAWQNGLLSQVLTNQADDLNKADGGYIVGLLDALRPGATDVSAIADAVVAAVGADIAGEVVSAIGLKLAAGTAGGTGE